jgi:hypothetical protein
MPRRAGDRIAAAAIAVTAIAATAGSASGQYPQPPAPEPTVRPNPCVDPIQGLELRCPDLQMAPPRDLYTSGRGKPLLHARNDIRSRGEGPLEVRGRRSSKRYMSVRQGIHTTDGGVRTFETDAELVFYRIPKQGPYWKFEDAARFELWTIDPATNARGQLVRTGPKLIYCFRDLKRTGSGGPKKRIYPSCSQDPAEKKRTLGTSVGWSDIYPSGYHQNWINVRGLKGCFEFVMTADPKNLLFENDESNNEGSRRIELPAKGKKVRGC